MNRPLLWTAAFEALVVLALGIAVVARGAEAPAMPEGTPVPQPAEGDRAEQEVPARRAAEGPAPTVQAEARKAATPPAEAVPFGDPLGLVLYGTVQDEDGNPLDGFRVSVTAADEAVDLRLTTTGSQARGRWSLAGIPPGRSRLRCWRSGFVAAEEEVELPPAPRIQRRDFVLEQMQEVKVRFLDRDGRRIDHAEIARAFGSWGFQSTAILATEGPLPARIPLDEQGDPAVRTVGRWRASREDDQDDGVAGRVLLSRPPPVHISAQSGGIVLQSHRVEPGQDEVTFILTPEQVEGTLGTVTLRVVDAQTGHPVPDVFVRIGRASGPPDARGSVTRTLVPGDHSFLVSSDGRYAHEGGAFHLEPGQELDLGIIGLHAGRGCTVTVVDASGNGADANLVLDALDSGNPRMPKVAWPVGQARAGRGFELKGLGPRRHLLRAFSPRQDMLAYAAIDGADPPRDLRLVLRPTISVALENALDTYQTAHVVVRDVQGLPLWTEELTSRSRGGPRLPAGTYRVEVFGEGLDRSYPLTVAPGGATLEVP